MRNPMSEVVNVVPMDDYRLEIELDTGRTVVIDMKPLLRDPVYAPLKDEKLFRRVRIDQSGDIEWPNGLDLCMDWDAYG
jgi:hypothetical protein